MGVGFFDDFGPDGLDAAFDAAVLMKVLPKFHGTRGKLRAFREVGVVGERTGQS
jgi:hypothetical protein